MDRKSSLIFQERRKGKGTKHKEKGIYKLTWDAPWEQGLQTRNP